MEAGRLSYEEFVSVYPHYTSSKHFDELNNILQEICLANATLSNIFKLIFLLYERNCLQVRNISNTKKYFK